MNQDVNADMIAALDRVMRLLRRRPNRSNFYGRGTYRILHTIETEGEITTRQLAEKLDIRTSSLNEKLPKLEEAELIQRKRAEKDQRVFVVSLLSKGREYLEDIREERKDFLRSLNGILSQEETMALKNLLDQFANGIEEIIQDQGLDKQEMKE